MITTPVKKAIQDVLSLAIAKGYEIKAKKNTFLDEFITFTSDLTRRFSNLGYDNQLLDTDDGQSEQTVDKILERVIDATDYSVTIPKFADDDSEHPIDTEEVYPFDDELANRSKSLTNILLGQVNHARNIVVPIVTALASATEENKKSIPADPTKNIRIDICSIPELLSITTVANSVEAAALAKPTSEWLEPPVFPEPTSELVNNLIHTSSKEVDDMINELISLSPAETLENIYRIFFVNQKDPLEFIETSDVNEWLLAFIMLSNVEATPPEGAKGTLADLKSYTGFYKSIIAKKILDYQEAYQKAVSGDIVVRRIPNNQIIQVWEPTYEDWLKNGGSTETILGVMVSNKPWINTKRFLSEEKVNMETQWAKYMVATVGVNKLSRASRIIGCFNKAIDEWVSGNGYANLVESGEDVLEQREARDTLQDYVSGLSAEELECTYTVATKCACMLFKRGDDLYFLDLMKEVSEAAKAINVDIDTEAAAAIATHNYFVTWLVNQLEITRGE